MRIVILDAWDFDDGAGEQYLAVACAAKQEYRTARQFHQAVSLSVSDCQSGKPPLQSRVYFDLKKCIELIAMVTEDKVERETVTSFTIYSDDWNDKEAIIEAVDHWYWCYWYTTA